MSHDPSLSTGAPNSVPPPATEAPTVFKPVHSLKELDWKTVESPGLWAKLVASFSLLLSCFFIFELFFYGLSYIDKNKEKFNDAGGGILFCFIIIFLSTLGACICFYYIIKLLPKYWRLYIRGHSLICFFDETVDSIGYYFIRRGEVPQPHKLALVLSYRGWFNRSYIFYTSQNTRAGNINQQSYNDFWKLRLVNFDPSLSSFILVQISDKNGDSAVLVEAMVLFLLEKNGLETDLLGHLFESTATKIITDTLRWIKNTKRFIHSKEGEAIHDWLRKEGLKILPMSDPRRYIFDLHYSSRPSSRNGETI